MCGRKTLTKGKLEIIERLSIVQWDDNPLFQPSFNIAPTQFHPVMLLEDGRKVKMMRWGLIPGWAKEESSLPILINARVETLTTKPSFAQLVDYKRCLIIADGYYEWRKTGEQKQPYYIHHQHGDLLLMAGLWSDWQSAVNQTLLTYTVITTEASPELSFIHPRMPAMVALEQADQWLSANNRFSQVRGLLLPGQPDLEAYPVSPLVNSVRHNSPECIRPHAEGGTQTAINF